MMQIVPVGAQARRAAAVGRLLGPLAWLAWLGATSMLALRLRRGQYCGQHGGQHGG